MFPDVQSDEIAAHLDRTVARLLRTARIRKPPIDALRVATSLGIVTAVDQSQEVRARYVELRAARGGAARPAILLRPEPRLERRHWAIAHEIGEQQASTIFRRLSIDPRTAPPTAREWVANQLANRLLLPTRWLARAGRDCGWNLVRLKECFPTASHELILRRMLDFPPPVIVSIYDNGALTFRRSNCGGRPPLTKLERECRRAVHESGRPDVRCAVAFSVHGWPVHEAEWKRELLRVELLEDGEPWLEDCAETLEASDSWPAATDATSDECAVELNDS